MDSAYLEFCTTDEQRRTVQAVIDCKGQRSAAKALGKNPRTVERMLKVIKRQAELRHYSPQHGMHDPLSEIETLTGRSRYIKPDGTPGGVWIKSKVDEQIRAQRMAEWIDRLAEDVKPLPPIAAPKSQDNDMLAVIPMGDPHFGMYSWAEETGDDFDLGTADRLTRGAIDRLVSLAPPAAECLLINLGDFFHADNTTNATPASHNALDVDTRHDKILQVAEDCIVYCIRRLLTKFGTVHFWSIPGNHDPHCASPLSRILRAYFRNNPRVKINVKAGKFAYMRFGKNLIGSTHGDGPKLADLPLLMATDRPEDWGKTEYRYWYTGHIHHRSAKEYPGASVEAFRTLAGKDAWHAGKGYRSGRDMCLIAHHRQFGEVMRLRADIAMIEESAP